MAQLERDRDLRGLVRVLEDTSADSATKANAGRALRNLARDTNNNAVVAASLSAGELS